MQQLVAATLVAQTGAVDPSFTLGPIGVTLNQLAQQRDGKILAGGQFTSFHATTVSNVVRLNENGTVDTGFAPPPMTQFGGILNATIHALAVQPDGKILLGGGFDSVGGVARTNLVRLNVSGSLDESFDVSTGDAKVVWRVAAQEDGTAFVGGAFDRLGGVARPGFARLTASGAVDTSFAPNLSPYLGPNVHAFAVQADGKILIGGAFATFTGSLAYYGVLRLSAHGTLDDTFTPPSLPAQSSRIFYLVIQSDGKIVVAGSFRSIAGVTQRSIARLNSDGTMDSSWPGPGVFSANQMFGDVKSMVGLVSGKILIAGTFEQYNGETSLGIVRLNADGTRDPSFGSPGVNVFRALSMGVQSDGGILLGGTLSIPGESTSLVRLAAGSTRPTLVYSIRPGGTLRFTVLPGFRLQSKPNLAGTWADAGTAATIDVPMTDPSGFFQLMQ